MQRLDVTMLGLRVQVRYQGQDDERARGVEGVLLAATRGSSESDYYPALELEVGGLVTTRRKVVVRAEDVLSMRLI